MHSVMSSFKNVQLFAGITLWVSEQKLSSPSSDFLRGICFLIEGPTSLPLPSTREEECNDKNHSRSLTSPTPESITWSISHVDNNFSFAFMAKETWIYRASTNSEFSWFNVSCLGLLSKWQTVLDDWGIYRIGYHSGKIFKNYYLNTTESWLETILK